MVATMSLSTINVSPVKGATTSSTLVWSDEFNGNSIDASKWGFEIGTGSNGWGNNEQQYYTNRTDNAYVADGALHIRAKKKRMVEKIIHQQDLIQMENLHLHMDM